MPAMPDPRDPVDSAPMSDRVVIRRALVSVYDKTGLEPLVRALHGAGVEIVSTGSTAATIEGLGLPVTSVEQVTEFAEMLDGRVKTLHPRIHAGLLADQDDAGHMAALEALGIPPFQLLVSNLYPFAQTVASGATAAGAVEQIDIGGPAMVRSSAKNHASVAVVVDPASYPDVIEAIRSGGFTLVQRQRLALAAFRHTADYDMAVAGWLGSAVAPDDVVDDTATGFPGWIAQSFERAGVLRYGENPHQRAALYVTPGTDLGIAHAEQLAGKEMSYNNYTDADAAWRAVHDFVEPCVAIIKHANPCGIALGSDIAEAHRKAHACDPVSAFGGVVAANRPVSTAMADQLADVFTEVVVAPGFDDGVVEALARKKNLRLLLARPTDSATDQRPVSGGLLVQSADRIDTPGDAPANWTLATGAPADPATLRDLRFAWRAVRAVKSNAILLATDEASVGVGMGQVNRVDAARLAVDRAGDRAAGAVAASDAFFPFPDGLEILLAAGVRAVVQPGGSVRDQLATDAATAVGATMYLTGTRHFTH
jgi:phosphoribosylaminoimidazolecarboxamide formyltransferase/IMP cyclohydrolase